MSKDYLAGALMAVLGGGVAYSASRLPLGTLVHMGPGMFPTALGTILLGLGVLIALNRSPDGSQDSDHHGEHLHGLPDLRGCLAITASIVSFILLTDQLGLLTGAFISVLIAAQGDRQARLKNSLVLAGLVSTIGTLVFIYLLKINLPVLPWGGA